MTKFKANEEVWVNGAYMTVVGVKTHTGVPTYFVLPKKLTQGLHSDMAKAYSEHQLEVPAYKKFMVGQKVQSHHTFKGYVIGFEEETNRVICKSIHPLAEESRKRYAYRVDEIMVRKDTAPDEEVFASYEDLQKANMAAFGIGKSYSLKDFTGELTVISVAAHPQAGFLVLKDVRNRSIAVIPSCTTCADLPNFGIEYITEL